MVPRRRAPTRRVAVVHGRSGIGVDESGGRCSVSHVRLGHLLHLVRPPVGVPAVDAEVVDGGVVPLGFALDEAEYLQVAVGRPLLDADLPRRPGGAVGAVEGDSSGARPSRCHLGPRRSRRRSGFRCPRSQAICSAREVRAVASTGSSSSRSGLSRSRLIGCPFRSSRQ
jgi:hypothetical protein